MTDTELANMALAHNGVAPVDDIADKKPSAESCLSFIKIARQTFIIQSRLHSARKEIALALSSGEASEIYDYIYDEPADCIDIIEIWNGDITADPVIFETGAHSSKTKTVIKTDKEEAVLIYLVDITNLNVFKPADIIAISYLLGSFITMPNKKDRELKAYLEAEYRAALSVAIQKDRNSQGIDVVNNDRFKSIENSRR